MFGFLNIDKPQGVTSHDVVAFIRRLLKARGISDKVGHGGTLDPLATGVLVVCLGAATRLSDYVMHTTKIYRADIHLGVSTDTYDAEGLIIAEKPLGGITQTEIEAVLASFVGTFDQIPPMYSAIKQGGRKLYELARAGQVVARTPRPVTIHQLHLVAWSAPKLTIEVVCGAGTYIRSLAHDIGEVLGVGGHLSALRRLASGSFRIDDAVALDALEASLDWGAYLKSPLTPFDDWLKLTVSEEEAQAIRQGRYLARVDAKADERAIAIGEDGQLVAILASLKGHYWKPHKVFLR